MTLTFKTKTIAKFTRASLAGIIILAAVQLRAGTTYEPYNFSTFAGGHLGYDDGIGTAASFVNPLGIAADASGNLYVADTLNETVRKITPAGVVSTLAGRKEYGGYLDGVGPDAWFNYPAAVTVDTLGNVYVADANNSSIRKIAPNGAVTTFAGIGSFGSVFQFPLGIATDGSNNVYVADNAANLIRKITPGGVVMALAGSGDFGHDDGTNDTASFNGPMGLATDSSGNVYVADMYNCTIRKITPDGVVTTLAGQPMVYGSSDGTGSAATFDHPYGLATDSAGNVYVADSHNATIRKVTPAGVVTTLAGIPLTPGSSDGRGSAATFSNPVGVATDSAGNLYVVDAANNSIRKGLECAPISLAPLTLPAGNLSSYNQAITASGGAAPYAYAVTFGSLPAGLTLETNGTFSGSPFAFGTSTFTVTATDTNGCTGTADYTLVIGPTGNGLDGNSPVLTITSPHNLGVISNGLTVTVTGTAKDSISKYKTGVAAVYYSCNGAAQQLATTANKFTNWTANITLTPGWNTFVAQAVDYRGNTSSITESYYAGTPTNFSGAYEGTFYSHTTVNPPASVDPQTSGIISLNVTSRGVYNGKLYIDGKNWPFHGTFDHSGNSTLTHRPLGRVQIQSDGQSAIGLDRFE